MTAIGLILAARSRGLRIPEDLAVVGFDDIPFASFSCPPLTTIAQPKYEMGKRAAEMVLDLLDPSPSREQMCNVVFKGRLVVRESTGRGRWSC